MNYFVHFRLTVRDCPFQHGIISGESLFCYSTICGDYQSQDSSVGYDPSRSILSTESANVWTNCKKRQRNTFNYPLFMPFHPS